jgi:two-component system, OmpR family, heavy metal sensor histidine kinase CusS
MTQLPFRLRIALLSALISGAVLVAFGVTAWLLMYRERLAALDREIRALAYRHPGWMGGRANYERLSSVIELVFGEERREQLILLVKDAAGQTRYISSHWPKELDADSMDLKLEDNPESATSGQALSTISNSPAHKGPPTGRGPRWMTEQESNGQPGPGFGRQRANMAAPITFSKIPRFQTVTLASSTWRLGILGDHDDRLVLGLNLVDLQAELGRMRNAFVIVLPLALFVIGWGGWWIAGHAMRPLRSITQVAEKVTARGLDQRIPLSNEDPEIARLVSVLNGMMDRLEKSFGQATRFSADASHELKTPLAVMQGQLEQALQAAPKGSTEQQTYAVLLEESQRLKTIIQSLLLLAQADAGQLPLARSRLNLSNTVSALMEDIEALATDQRIKVNLKAMPNLWIMADGPLLHQAILNLLHNALRYNQPDGWIDVQLSSDNQSARLMVINSGPGIPPADQPRLFERFFRADSSRSRSIDGVGLGLSLSREIARAHHGNLELVESQPGRTCFVLSLPQDDALT